jgi:small subunit ribosomal protein S1
MARFRYVDPDDQKSDPFGEVNDTANEFEILLSQDKAQTSQRRFKAGEPILAQVVRITKDYIFFDLGGKSTGSLSLDEYNNNAEKIPTVGQEVQTYVREDNGSEVVLTKSLKADEANVHLMRAALENKTPIEAKVEKVNAGGFEVSVGGKRGFVPMSQMSLERIEKPDDLIGSVFQFHVMEIKEGGKNIVLSRKTLLKEEKALAAENLMKSIQVGNQYQAVITKIMPFGAFADIGGVDGLIPISEISFSRVKNIRDFIKEGEKVSVKITNIETSPKRRIGLTLKDSAESPTTEKQFEPTTFQKPQSLVQAKASGGIFASAFADAKKRK